MDGDNKQGLLRSLEEALPRKLLRDGNCLSSGWNIWVLFIIGDDDLHGATSVTVCLNPNVKFTVYKEDEQLWESHLWTEHDDLHKSYPI